MIEGKLRLKGKDAYGNNANESLGMIDATDLMSSDSATRIAFATKIDTFSRQVYSLLTSTYENTEIETTLDINEILAE